MIQLTSQQLLNYSVSLYLRKPVYYIRLKSQDSIYSLSLRTKHKKTALSKLQMVKQELELERLTSKFNSFQELQRHFKSTVELDTNIKPVHFISQTSSIHSQAITSINELCQLQVKDLIKSDNNIIYLDINAQGIEGKSLKNQYSARTIPLL